MNKIFAIVVVMLFLLGLEASHVCRDIPFGTECCEETISNNVTFREHCVKTLVSGPKCSEVVTKENGKLIKEKICV